MEWVGNVGRTHTLVLIFRPIMILGMNIQASLSVGVSSYRPLGVVGNPFPRRLSYLLTVPCFVVIFFGSSLGPVVTFSLSEPILDMG